MLFYLIHLLVLLLAAFHQNIALIYPGTLTRPILSDSEASRFTIENYLSDWKPEEIQIPENPDYEVKVGESIQDVVNKAIRNNINTSTRIYIKIEAGHYMETVYIKTDIPLTLYGADSQEEIHIMANISASATAVEYQNIVNPNGARYEEGDPAWDLYNSCATTEEEVIGTFCTAVLWIVSDNFQLVNVTVHNPAIDMQAVAVRTAADKIQLQNSKFLSYQDTLGLGINDGDQVERVLVQNCYIEGGVDYIFGAAAAVFHSCTFNTVVVKETGGRIIFAPDTDPKSSYGFLVINSNITGDPSFLGSNKVKLARSWDHNVLSADQYIPGESPNGQLVIRDSFIDNVINSDEPYAPAATSSRNFSTSISADRNLDDNRYNRLWEYSNNGA